MSCITSTHRAKEKLEPIHLVLNFIQKKVLVYSVKMWVSA